jgi:hypothetical protein
MRELNQNENLILIEENEMNIEKYVERKKNGNVQTKNNNVKENGEQIMKKILEMP